MLTIDASVVLKWFFPDSDVEPDAEQALDLLEAIRRGDVAPVQKYAGNAYPGLRICHLV